MEAYAIQTKNTYRAKGFSGGFLQLLMETVIRNDGYVCAPIWSNELELQYQIVNELFWLDRIKFPFLVSASISDVEEQMLELLSSGKKILFIGAPCQVQYLYDTYKKERNLYLVEIQCGGMVEIDIFEKYLKQFDNVKDIWFTDNKKYFYHNTKFIVKRKDNTYFRQDQNDNIFFRAIQDGLSVKEECLHCSFQMDNSKADIVVGDIIGDDKRIYLEDRFHQFDKLGTSYVEIISTKAKNLFCKLLDDISIVKQLDDTQRDWILTPKSRFQYKSMRNRFRKLLTLKSYDFDKAYSYAINSKYDVAINGDWADYNYGGVIVAVALANVLEELGYSSILVQYGHPNYNSKILFSMTGNRIWQNIDISSEYKNAQECEELNTRCDVYLLGSDINWCHDNMFNGTYLGEYVYPGKKKISYSTSFGDKYFFCTREEKRKAQMYLSDFQGISLREDDGCTICKDQFGIDTVHVLDPVLLCDLKWYDELIDNTELDLPEKYVLYYSVHEDPLEEKEKSVHMIADKLNLPVVTVRGYSFNIGKVENCYSIDQFLLSIKKATFFIGDSFHGMCFALLFHIPFVVFANPIKGASRVESLAREFDVCERVVVGYTIGNLLDQIIVDDLNWYGIDEKLSERRKNSMEWLRKEMGEVEQKSDQITGVWIEKLAQRINILEKKIEYQMQNRVKEYIRFELKGSHNVIIRGAGTETREWMPLIEEVFEEMGICLKCFVDVNTEKAVEYKNQLWYAVSDADATVYNDVDKIIIISSRHHQNIRKFMGLRGIDEQIILDLSDYISKMYKEI